MEIKINAIIPNQNNTQWVNVFGYSSKSQPGLEINGINGKGRAIKEKITFLSKKRRLRFPLQRFVLCVEGENLERAQLDYLELPLLLCFWSMTGSLPLKRLDNCFSCGKVSLEGELKMLPGIGDALREVDSHLKAKDRTAIYIGDTLGSNFSQIKQLSVFELLNEDIGGFS